MQAELVLDCKNHHGEGIQWNPRDGRIWWTDIEGRALWWYAPEGGASGHIDMPDRVCTFAPRAHGPGFIVAFADEIALFDPETGARAPLHRFEPDNPHSRTNDGRTDRQGRFIVGGMNEGTGAPDSSVIRIDPDGSVAPLLDKVACANSICFSPDGETMYFADTPERVIRAYGYDGATGRLGEARVFADMSDAPGLPDGSCVDAEGGVWNAEWEGRRVIRVAPDGRIDRIIDLPTWKPTCCAFGGDDLGTLFITTSRLMSDAQALADDPHAGGLFAVRPGVKGVSDTPFNG